MDKEQNQENNEIPLEEEIFMTDQEYQLMKQVCFVTLAKF